MEEVNKRDVVYGYGDRFDELYAFNRTVRKGNFKYSRNFLPYHPKSLYAAYRYKQMAFREWEQLYKEGKLDEVQKRFFEPQGPEELYDLSADPYETRNLAGLPEYAGRLKEMRRLLEKNLLAQNDLGLLPESVWLEEGKQNPVEYGRQSHARINKLLAAADLQLLSYPEAKKKIKKALASSDPVERYWALTACVWNGKQAVEFAGEAEKLLADPSVPVRSRAAVFLMTVGRLDAVDPLKKILSEATSGAESLEVLNDMAYLNTIRPDLRFALTPEDVAVKCQGTDWRVDFLK